jgi:vacuolar-type H+-ATPase subunit F/Vma7
MMIADEVTAVGFRLAGVDCHTPALEALPALFERLRAQAGLLLISAEMAAHLPAPALAQALSEQRPPLLVIPDIRGRVRPADLSALLRRQLGLAE